MNLMKFRNDKKSCLINFILVRMIKLGNYSILKPVTLWMLNPKSPMP